MESYGEASAPANAVGSGTHDFAGQSAMTELLRVNSATPRRSGFARFFGASPLSAEGRSAYRAAMGEIEVGTVLDNLGDGWHAFHSVSLGEDGSELDHLIVGPAGVYIVTTTAHPGGTVYASQRTFMAADIRYPHIRNMEYEMGRVERLLSTASGLSVEVSGILAVVDPKSLTVTEAHRDVAVLASSTVARWLGARATVIRPADVAMLAASAARRETWGAVEAHSVDTHAVDTHNLVGRFEAVRAEVTRAGTVQRLWATVLTVVSASAFIFVTYSILVMALGAAVR